MNFGTGDEEIGQELTEGGAFCDVAPAVFFSIARAGCKSPSFMEKPPDDVLNRCC